MTLGELTTKLLALESQYGSNIKVKYRHTSSDDCGGVYSANVTNRVSDCGPFDLDDGEFYVSLNVGGN